MKLNTAFKISALAAALSLTATVQAVTVNDIYIGQNDPSANQFVDLGSGTNTNVGTAAPSGTYGALKYDVGNGKEIFEITLKGNEPTKLYEYVDVLVNGSPVIDPVTGLNVQQLQEIADQDAARTQIEGLEVASGGVTNNTTQTDTINTVKKLVDSQQVYYGETVQTQESVSIIGGLIDINKQLTDTLDAALPTSPLETQAEKSVATGIIKQDGNGSNVYGLEVKTKDKNGTSSTTVTSDGVATTGNVSAGSITLNGQDIAQTIADGDAATLAAANTYTDTTATTLRGEIADGDAATLATARTEIAAGDAATLANANTYTNTTATTLRGEIAAGDAATLTAANAYTDQAVQGFNSRVNQLNQRVNDVEKTAYRGIAIALAAQQQIPNIGAGQMAVFGGVGHYEGESAAALGLASVLADGRTSVSAALGFAGGSEIGGRVGVAYVFGGK